MADDHQLGLDLEPQRPPEPPREEPAPSAIVRRAVERLLAIARGDRLRGANGDARR